MAALRKLALLAALGSVSLAQAVVYNNPTYGGQYLDWCLMFATSCGKPAADRFCQLQGFSQAGNFSMRPNITFTRIIGEVNRTCYTPRDGVRCDGFSFIDCM